MGVLSGAAVVRDACSPPKRCLLMGGRLTREVETRDVVETGAGAAG